MMTMQVTNYNPQLLLADHRTPVRKMADQYRTLSAAAIAAQAGMSKFFPYQQEAIKALESDDIPFGTLSGRIRHLVPGEGLRMHRMEPSFKPRWDVHVYDLDFSKVEERILANLAAKRETIDKAFWDTVFGEPYRPHGINLTDPRSDRIDRLMRSFDPRQRKRGLRLWKVLIRERMTVPPKWDDEPIRSYRHRSDVI